MAYFLKAKVSRSNKKLCRLILMWWDSIHREPCLTQMNCRFVCIYKLNPYLRNPLVETWSLSVLNCFRMCIVFWTWRCFTSANNNAEMLTAVTVNAQGSNPRAIDLLQAQVSRNGNSLQFKSSTVLFLDQLFDLCQYTDYQLITIEKHARISHRNRSSKWNI